MNPFVWSGKDFSLDQRGLWDKAGGAVWSKQHDTLLESKHSVLQAKFDSGEIGFFHWPTQVPPATLQALETAAGAARRKFKGALIFGIGGSYLGPAAILQALRLPPDAAQFPIHWLSNVDSGAVRDAGFFLEQGPRLAVVISKSGNTAETLAGFFHFASRFSPDGVVAITDPKQGELRRLAQEQGWQSFEVPPAIGGRFSVLSAVGLFPVCLAGLSANELLQGARDVRHALLETPPSANPAYRLALAKHLWDREHRHPIQYLMPYASPLRLLADWYVQLWAESLGKKIKGGVSVGPTPAAALGTSDQHSMLQLFKEGPADKVLGFIDVTGEPRPQGELVISRPPFPVRENAFLLGHRFDEIAHLACRATEQSLTNSGVPCYRFEMPQVTARALGGWLFFQEVACAFAGELYGVDAFNQPGVEEAKKLLRASLG